MQTFRTQVIEYIKKVPKGMVVSYGQVAAAAGSPRAARQVGGILRALNISDGNVPWWRVINNQGVISIKGNWTATKELQSELLKKDKVTASEHYTVDIAKHRFK